MAVIVALILATPEMIGNHVDAAAVVVLLLLVVAVVAAFVVVDDDDVIDWDESFDDDDDDEKTVVIKDQCWEYNNCTNEFLQMYMKNSIVWDNVRANEEDDDISSCSTTIYASNISNDIPTIANMNDNTIVLYHNELRGPLWSRICEYFHKIYIENGLTNPVANEIIDDDVEEWKPVRLDVNNVITPIREHS